jgi:hypothetical protein
MILSKNKSLNIFDWLKVITLSVVTLNVVMLIVDALNVVMLSVAETVLRQPI